MDEKLKKEVSELKFSDFQSAGITFKHDATGVLECLGIGEEEAKDMGRFLTEMKLGGNAPSHVLEATINGDCKTAWKVVSILKLGEAIKTSQLVNAISKLPDETPLPIAKAMLIIALIGGER